MAFVAVNCGVLPDSLLESCRPIAGWGPLRVHRSALSAHGGALGSYGALLCLTSVTPPFSPFSTVPPRPWYSDRVSAAGAAPAGAGGALIARRKSVTHPIAEFRGNRQSPARTEPVRLLYVQPSEVFGGAERQGVLHMARLAEHGFDVVPVVGPGRLITRALEEQGIDDYVFLEHLTHEASYPVAGLGKLRFAAGAVRDWLATQHSLVGLAVRHRSELIFASRSTGWLAASGVARGLGIPLVWRGGGRPTSRTELAILAVLARFFCPDLLVANCRAVRGDLAPALRCPTEILPNGVDVQRFDPARVRARFRHELNLGPGVPVVGFPSRPAPEKGMELLAEVAERTARRVPDVRFLVAGEFGWRPHFEELFAARGLYDRVRFLGHVEDVETFLRSCDVVVLTSKARSIEGSPNALLEAMAMERPVVATRVGGVEEVITDGVEGFLVPDGDADAFSRRLAELLGDRDLQRRMGTAGRAHIVAEHHHEKVAADLARMLHEVLARAGTSPRPLAHGATSRPTRRTQAG
jgi:glycosyltransferase involved in cell wall biosynthesis